MVREGRRGTTSIVSHRLPLPPITLISDEDASPLQKAPRPQKQSHFNAVVWPLLAAWAMDNSLWNHHTQEDTAAPSLKPKRKTRRGFE
jgi:hypothetical protein